jgi:beta-xylosidase
VHTKYGEDWFLHFQDKEAYGRVVHLNPVDWSTGWPIMGQKG